jgi:FkbM family methyltransferase
MDRRLIFDIGSNDGSDTAFYLAKGFDVVAVDADTELCERVGRRFAAEIAAGRLHLLAEGIADRAATMTFFKNVKDDWSSFRRGSKATQEFSHREVAMPTRPLADLLQVYGVPYYMKLDIEGFELEALSTLAPGSAMPPYLSFELNWERARIMEIVRALGYDRFQLIRQGEGILPPPPEPAREGRFVPMRFTGRHSGCFGRELPEDAWQPAAPFEAHVDAALAAADARAARGEEWGWFDIHCRHRAAPV